MISDLGLAKAGSPRRQREKRAVARKERDLRWCVEVTAAGCVEIRYFQHPQDVAGVVIRLTAREREELCFALAQPNHCAFLFRDDRVAEVSSDQSGKGKVISKEAL